MSAKRVLIVLDNARDTDQVRPLLPGNPNCQVIVTSRNDLIGLVTKQAAHPLTLNVLPETEARQLLQRRLGADRIAAEPDAVDQIIAACARLPLALAIVAARAAIRPDFPLASLTITLTGEDPDTDIRTIFSWSYEQLSAEAQRLFRLLGLHPGPDISAAAAASLAGTPRPPLAELTRTHLIEEHQPGRYTFHDLLRAYASRLSEPDRHTATHRMLDHYLHTAFAAERLLDPMLDPIPPLELMDGVTPEQLSSHEQAMAWFAAEHRVLLAVLDHAATAGFDAHTRHLAPTLEDFLSRRGHTHDRIVAWRAGLAAAERLGDQAGQAEAHRFLARTYDRLGRAGDAHAHLRQAIDLFGVLGDRLGQARAHRTLGGLYEREKRYAEALAEARRALALHREIAHRPGMAAAMNAIGWYESQLGRHEEALAWCGQALALCQELGNRTGEADTWDSLGYARHQLGQFDAAADCYQRALDIYRELGDRYFEAQALTHLGDTHDARGDHAAARATWDLALATLEDLDHPDAADVRARLERLDRPPPIAQA